MEKDPDTIGPCRGPTHLMSQIKEPKGPRDQTHVPGDSEHSFKMSHNFIAAKHGLTNVAGLNIMNYVFIHNAAIMYE